MMLAGFEQPTQGDILLEGEPVAHTPPHKRNIGMVFQNYALFPHMTVAENLAFPLKVRSMASAAVKDRVARALRMVSLEGFEKRRPFQLSGGQQQRVAVARALVFSPSLVLMDEPLGALDRHLREQMQFEIKKLHRDLGLTVVYVTHDQSEALTLSDRIAVFNDGHIQQIDTPETLYERPANAFVATFVGENNKLMGTVEAADEDYAVVKLDGGQIIKSSRRDCGGSGARTVVTIRPEHLVIVPDQAVSGDRSAISAHVEDMVFHGDHMRLKLSVPGGNDIIVKSPTRLAELRGDTVFVAFKVNDAPAFRPME
jgi:putative spermidine/putrescine transport system ATP-binding protein